MTQNRCGGLIFNRHQWRYTKDEFTDRLRLCVKCGRCEYYQELPHYAGWEEISFSEYTRLKNVFAKARLKEQERKRKLIDGRQQALQSLNKEVS